MSSSTDLDVVDMAGLILWVRRSRLASVGPQLGDQRVRFVGLVGVGNDVRPQPVELASDRVEFIGTQSIQSMGPGECAGDDRSKTGSDPEYVAAPKVGTERYVTRALNVPRSSAIWARRNIRNRTHSAGFVPSMYCRYRP